MGAEEIRTPGFGLERKRPGTAGMAKLQQIEQYGISLSPGDIMGGMLAAS